MYIRLSGIVDNSVVNGIGNRTVVFGTGCNHHCYHCQNEDIQNPKEGTDFPIENVIDRIEKNAIVNRKRVTFSGGDPFFQAEAFTKLAEKLKEKGYNIWCYTGYTIEQIINSKNKYFLKLLSLTDTLVDGKFVEELMADAPKYAGSSNQRIIDVKEFALKNNLSFNY